MSSSGKSVSGYRVVWLVSSLLVSLLAGFYGGEVLRSSEKPSEYIGLLFSVLSASIFAVITIIGDPSMIASGSRRLGYESAKAIQIRVQRLSVVFVVHISTLFLLVISEIVEFKKLESMYWVFGLLAFCASFGFLLALSLPFELAKIQRDRLKQELSSRKQVF